MARSRSSVPIIDLLMQQVSHEYMLYVTFITSNIVLRHPTFGVSKNVQIPTVSEFNVLTRFHETILTVKSVSSSEI